MRKFGKKLLATALGAVLAFSSVPAIAAEPDSSSYGFDIQFDANGGTFDGGATTETVEIRTTLKNTVTAHSPNVGASGDVEGPLSPLGDSSTQLVYSSLEDNGETYKLYTATVEGQTQTGGLYDISLYVDGEDVLSGDGMDLDTVDATVDNDASVSISGNGARPVDDNNYYGHYFTATGYYYNPNFEIPTPHRDGYTFAGWSYDSDYLEEWQYDPDYKDDQFVYAIWEEDEPEVSSYNITYDLDGGYLPEGYENPTTYTSEDSYMLINPEKDGAMFLGWTGTGLDEITEDVTIPEGSTGDRSYVAHWEEEEEEKTEYSISYDLDGGELPEGALNPQTYTEDDSFTLVNPEKDGVTFLGWTGTDIDGVSTNVTIPQGSTGDRVYVANWSEPEQSEEYSITYNLDGGQIAEGENPTSYTEDDEITLINPVKDNAEFAGWTGTGLEEPTLNVVIPSGSTGDREYTATWTESGVYTITYDLDGGYLPEGYENPTTYTSEDSYMLVNPEKEGAIFLGWTGTGLEEMTDEVVIPEGSTGNRSYVAHWDGGEEEEEYSITYKLHTDASLGNPTSYKASDLPITLTNPTREGYAFAGWTGTILGNPVTECTIPEGTTGDLEFEANWTADAYTINYVLEGGVDPGNPTSFTKKELPITLKDPTRSGFEFIGWTDAEHKTPVKALKITTEGNKKFKANWKAIEKTYEISYTLHTDASPGNPKAYTESELPLKLKDPTRDGYTFLGWTGTGLSKPVKGYSIPKGTTGNLSFEAHWQQNSEKHYTITYKLNGGTATNPENYTVSDLPLTINAPTRSGYTFTGWTGTGLPNPVKNLRLAKGTIGNLTLEANWEPATEKTYTIEYDLGGASDPGNPTSYTAASLPITLIAPTLSGYKFTGWSGTGLSSKTLNLRLAKGTTGNLKFTANWEKNVSTGSLTVRNEVSGTGANLDKKFQYTIGIYNNGSGVNETYNCSGVTSGTMTFTNGVATVKLANAEELTISGIPVGYTVTIDQEAAEGYTTTPSSRHANGTMQSGRLTATFRNVYNGTVNNNTTPTPTPQTGSSNLTFTHVTNGDGADTEKKFVYTLTVMNGGTPLTGSYSYTGTGTGTVAFSAEGKISFTMKNGQTLTIQGLPTNATYTIAKNDTSDGYTLTKSREDGTITGDMTVTLTETKGNVTTSGASTTSASTTTNNKDAKNASLTNVATGDQNPILKFSVLGILALLCLVVAFGSRKKRA